ncbi:GNAT family N-acetyltransferase [Permianibacter aggregans]|uniref:Ribosomal protein S18 acetylase RimI-like enzyme n=1 Tax=Permianibacter aggregans TaxID=1510150 RepID=A0A4R6UD08_9GAMM|nr:GNAT family N-acetyltransferase [Permianibacter aggregans]QGX41121.1 GNAT family N-acetyltransferase [Permianibacter aggregans]TDQ44568.1 ribosomal protein S18 acetylase RimI-like enzyme [Permianibacter aggregans]
MLTIRAATAADVPQIQRFIEALADYEKLSHEVQATEEKLNATLFGDKPAAEVLIAEWQNKPAGFALFFHNYSTFLAKPGIYLEDLFVYPEFRGKGIGKALLIELARRCVENGFGRLEWSVLDWNTPAIDFYRSLGAKLMDEWTVNRVTGDALLALAKK